MRLISHRRVEKQLNGLPTAFRIIVRQAIRNLLFDPLGRNTALMVNFGIGARRCRVQEYRVFYSLTDEQIYVRSVVHKQDVSPKKLAQIFAQ